MSERWTEPVWAIVTTTTGLQWERLNDIDLFVAKVAKALHESYRSGQQDMQRRAVEVAREHDLSIMSSTAADMMALKIASAISSLPIEGARNDGQ